MKSSEFVVEHIIDNRRGIGATPYNTDIDYFGFVVSMRPSTFLKLAAPGGGSSVDYLETTIKEGGSVGAPTLYIKVPAEWKFDGPSATLGEVKIYAHEGRNRMMAIRNVEGDIPVETHILLRSSGVEWRARNITPEIISKVNAGATNEIETAFIKGPLFV